MKKKKKKYIHPIDNRKKPPKSSDSAAHRKKPPESASNAAHHTAVGAYVEETMVDGAIGVSNMVSPMNNKTSSNTSNNTNNADSNINSNTNIVGDDHDFVGRNLAQQILDAQEEQSAELASKGPDPYPVNNDTWNNMVKKSQESQKKSRKALDITQPCITDHFLKQKNG